jgi:phospholipid/cholesterol/gamma-HCH transport system substrate-binding protein
MARSTEEIRVGVVVIVGAVLFLTALVFVGGVNLFRKKKAVYTTYFKFAGGLEPGTFVRFGGLKVGTVKAAEIDPGDSTRIRVELSIADGTPVRTNSKARISSLGFLGENYVEVSPGSRDAALLPPGSEIASLEIVQLAEVFNNVNNITVNANKLVNDMDDRLLVLSDNMNKLVSSINETVGPENRQHLAAVLANADAMLAAEALGLRPVVPLGEWRLGFAAMAFGAFLVFTARDVLFLQWCLLTRMKQPVMYGILFLLLYNAAVGVVGVVISVISAPAR